MTASILYTTIQGRVLTGFLFPVNPMKKIKRKEKKKKILRISLKTLFIDFVLVI